MAAVTIQSEDIVGVGGVMKSPKSPPPWSSIVQGSPAAAAVEDQILSSPDDSDNGGNVGKKKAVWNKPSNSDGGVVEAAVSPFMGAVSWPALGESKSKSSPKSSSSDSLKDIPLLPASQVMAGNSSPRSHKLSTVNNANPTSTSNHVAPAKQRSMKRGGGSYHSNASANGGFSASHMSATNQGSVVENTHNTSGKPSVAAVESSTRDNTHNESQRGGIGSQPHNGNDHQHQRHTYRRSNSGQHSRGDGSYHHNYGSKRDQDRGNHEWNQHSRSFNGRDTHMQPQRGYPRSYIRPSVHTSPTFIPPPMTLPVRPFGNNMMYTDLPSPVFYVQGPPPPPESLRGMPFVGPIPPPMYFLPDHMLQGIDPMLHANIVSQIDYYFSNENLVKDTYLRKNMDEQGWVPVSLIAGFKKVLFLTDNVQLILDAVRSSTIVEVQGDKIRRRNDWMKWLMHPAAEYSNLSSPRAVEKSPNQDILTSQLQGVSLDAASTNVDSAQTFSSGEFNNQLQQAGGRTDQIGGQQAGLT
uniref:la-related protein 1C-like n=1 Tax=Erigeron canadensis TaxID=72917 RepID=UPI001CB9861A|nr:la-related protein 1C-like [Erigeron canadensis]